MQPAAPRVTPPFARLLLPLCLAAACAETYAQAPAPAAVPAAASSMQLKRSAAISGANAVGQPAPGPSHFEADQISGHDQRELIAEGKVSLRNLREQIEADWMRYEQPQDLAEARGNVVFVRERDRIEGSHLKLKLEARLGDIYDVHFKFFNTQDKPVFGAAKTLTFAGPDVYQLEDASYTTCTSEHPDWVLKMDDLRLDYISSLGSARKVQVNFLDVPILYTPWIDFALDDRRKNGFLAPTYGVSDARGLELMTPWYWNIAPNRDATIMPRLMTKRGLQLGGEFRYLEPSYKGELNGEFLPSDRQVNRDRYRLQFRHQHAINPRLSASLAYEAVSDDSYFTNLSSQVSQTSLVNLPRQANLDYNGGWWQAHGMLQTFQTLQDPAAPIVEPYSRLPQITLAASRENIFGSNRYSENGIRFDFNSELVYFNHRVDTRVQGARFHANPTFSFPLQTAYSVVTPRIGWYLSHYALDDATVRLSDSIGNLPAGGFTSTTRSLPMFSLDSSLILERDWSFLGSNYLQTLEPRAYYVYIPYKDQSRIPVFDSSFRELSLDQLFAENQFLGVDRINDANQLTLAVTSRFLDPDSGAERLQVTVGQRYYFDNQRVSLSGSTSTSTTSELLAQASGQITPQLRLNTGIQFDTGEGELTKANLGGTWRLGPGKLINADYRYTRDSLDQVDVSFQWPLAPRWYGMGRLNYSLRDSRLVEGLAGFEYNAGCWVVRGVMQQLVTTEDTSTSAFFLQLELRGLTKLGPNPLEILKRSVTGYAQSSEILE